VRRILEIELDEVPERIEKVQADKRFLNQLGRVGKQA
jgi:hypothetical protein